MICSVRDCYRELTRHDARAMCGKHYRRSRRGLSLTATTAELQRGPVVICGVNGCGRQQQARGFCSKHYQRLNRHGDPDREYVGANVHNWGGSEIGYRAAHRRVEKLRGKAREHPCVDCGTAPGGRSMHWSLSWRQMPLGSWKVNEHGSPYSADPWSYDARCVMCASRYDRSFIDHLQEGSE